MKTKIKKLAVVAAVMLCLAVGVQATLAAFTATGTATNVITMGNIKIKLHEQRLNAQQKLEPFEDVIGVVPGESVSKIVTVENTGNNPAWIRISIGVTIDLAKGVVGTADKTLVSFDIGDDWTELNGYYYYAKALGAGETTTPLFENVIFSDNMGNMYQKSTTTVDILVHGVQVIHNGTTVWEADGWPTPSTSAD